MQESRVGSKGELFPPKEIRKKLGLHAHTKVIYKVEEGRLIIEPVPTLEEVLSEAPTVEITLEEFKKTRKELSKKAEA
jgi:AbrB family looped-hinge helix DNA binding protein